MEQVVAADLATIAAIEFDILAKRDSVRQWLFDREDMPTMRDVQYISSLVE